MRRPHLALLLLSGCVISDAGAGQPTAMDALLRLVPADAAVAVLVPNLKALSDDMMRCLEGMDRAHLLLGTRPIDQLKSAAGFSSAVNDSGGAAALLLGGPGNLQPLVLIPVHDAQAFIEGNFVGRDGDARIRADGRRLFAMPLETHVALAWSVQTIQRYRPGPGAAEAWRAAIGEGGADRLTTGDAFVYLNRDGIRLAGEQLISRVPPVLGLDLARVVSPVEGARCAVMSVDFDPLAIIVRTIVQCDPQSELGRLTTGGPAAHAGLDLLPARPYYCVASLDISGAGGPDAVHCLARLLQIPDLLSWPAHCDSLQVAAYPSPAGGDDGLLTDAIAAFPTSQPAAVRQWLKQCLLQLQSRNDGIERRVDWADGKAVNEDLTADAYEVQFLNVSPHLAVLQPLMRWLFGRAGWRGYIGQSQHAVVMTFSRRPAVLEAALQAAASAPGARSGLDSQAAIRLMRTWMPGHRDIEVYISLGQLASFVQQVTAAMQLPQPAFLTGMEPSDPPIGLAADMHDHHVEAAAIIPAAALAALLDEALRRAKHGADEPAAVPPAGE